MKDLAHWGLQAVQWEARLMGGPAGKGLTPPKKLCAQVPMWKDDVGDALLVCPFGCSGEETDASSGKQQVAPHPGRSMAQ